MRTLQEKYNGIQEGKFSKENFLADARKELPNLITRFNGYDDAVQILKNRGMVVEGIHDRDVLSRPLSNPAIEPLDRSPEELGRDADARSHNILRMTYRNQINDPNISDEELRYILSGKGVKGFGGTPNAIDSILRDRNSNQSGLREAKLTKKSLTDYRYKPTNEMDKYPYEQILRGLRVELEGLGVQGTPTAEEYAKALAKVSKNLAKDSIFYTNQVAGVNPKVDLHDKMVPVTAKNSVDTFNGMKKAELKEGFKKLIKKVLSEEVIDVESYKEGVYEMYGPKSDAEYKRELQNYLEDNQIYGYTDMLFDILTAPDEEQVADNLADFLDDHQIYGYNKGLLAIFRDYANRDESEDEWDDADYERMSNSLKEDEDLFESKSLKDLL